MTAPECAATVDKGTHSDGGGWVPESFVILEITSSPIFTGHLKTWVLKVFRLNVLKKSGSEFEMDQKRN